jgi:Tol biopolymer transport system component
MGGAAGGGGALGAGGAAGCDLTKPFGTLTAIDAINSPASDDAFTLSADQLTGYIETTRTGGLGADDIWVTTRTTTSAKFSAPTLLQGGVNTIYGEVSPFLTKDGLRLLYGSSAAGNWDIYIAARPSAAAVFGAGAAVSGINTTDLDAGPWLSSDETQIYFCSARPGGLGGADIWVADFGTNGASNVRNLSSVNTTSDEEAPVLSADGLTIYFTSRQPGGSGGSDIWMAQRSTVSDGFGQSVNVAELNSPSNESPTWVSPDACTLFIASDKDSTSGSGRTGFDIYKATRGK